MAKKKHRKGSRAANVWIRMRRIANGMGQAGPNRPVYVMKGKRLIRLTRDEYTRLQEEAESLSYFAGYEVSPEDLVK